MAAHECNVEEVRARPLAVVRQRTEMAGVPRVIGETIGLVYAFLEDAPVSPDGHNVVVYHDRDQGVELEVGVEVSGDFAGTGRVAPSTSPGGRAAHLVHFGPYEELPAAHGAVRRWCAAEGHAITGTSWEVYGDWEDDPAKRRTDVYYALA